MLKLFRHSHGCVSNELPRFDGEFSDALSSSISNLEEGFLKTDFPNWSIPCDPAESVQGVRVLCLGPDPRTPGNRGSHLGC